VLAPESTRVPEPVLVRLPPEEPPPSAMTPERVLVPLSTCVVRVWAVTVLERLTAPEWVALARARVWLPVCVSVPVVVRPPSPASPVSARVLARVLPLVEASVPPARVTAPEPRAVAWLALRVP
jgi:hypothetical protein